jgi:hypothetical protein
MQCLRNGAHPVLQCFQGASVGVVMATLLSISVWPVAAQPAGESRVTESYECAANAHCTALCSVDGDKVMQTGGPKTLSVTMLAPNNYFVELVEENGQIHYAYLAGATIYCTLDGMTKKSG